MISGAFYYDVIIWEAEGDPLSGKFLISGLAAVGTTKWKRIVG